MTAILRDVPDAVAAALAAGTIQARAALFNFTLADGVTNLWFAAYDSDITTGGQTYLSRGAFVEHGAWNVSNTMEVPELAVTLRALNGGFNGGAQIKQQIHNGLFDGAAMLMSWAFMTSRSPADLVGVVPMFGGVTAGIDLTGTTAKIACRGKNNLLDQYAPRTLLQIGCNHAFCDAGCTLSRASFTATNTVGSGSGGPTPTFIPWGTTPGSPSVYQGGFLAMTSGLASGSRRSIAKADSTGLTLVYPLNQTPAAGDGFSAVAGCDKTFDSGSGQSCTDHSNTQHYRGFEFVPPPNSSY